MPIPQQRESRLIPALSNYLETYLDIECNTDSDWQYYSDTRSPGDQVLGRIEYTRRTDNDRRGAVIYTITVTALLSELTSELAQINAANLKSYIENTVIPDLGSTGTVVTLGENDEIEETFFKGIVCQESGFTLNKQSSATLAAIAWVLQWEDWNEASVQGLQQKYLRIV